MTAAEIIVVGGGPGGSTCAWKLRQAGREVLVLDKEEFPRRKPCAGWITPRVVRDLHLEEDNYPQTVSRFVRIKFHFPRRKFTLPTVQYAIRRVEFDNWLLQRAAVPVVRHTASDIRKEGNAFLIDGEFRCRYIVGAGGTHCPVYRTLFKEARPRSPGSKITAMEDEFPSSPGETGCHLLFPRDLPGYCWYVPKGNSHLNVGVGGISQRMDARGKSILQYWTDLLGLLTERSLVDATPIEPRGHVYYRRDDTGPVQIGSAYIVGDSAGLATQDMGEGIGPAVRSGILAANAILSRGKYRADSVPKYSVFELAFPFGQKSTHWKKAPRP